jgi:hypothetical protein
VSIKNNFVLFKKRKKGDFIMAFDIDDELPDRESGMMKC